MKFDALFFDRFDRAIADLVGKVPANVFPQAAGAVDELHSCSRELRRELVGVKVADAGDGGLSGAGDGDTAAAAGSP